MLKQSLLQEKNNFQYYFWNEKPVDERIVILNNPTFNHGSKNIGKFEDPKVNGRFKNIVETVNNILDTNSEMTAINAWVRRK